MGEPKSQPARMPRPKKEASALATWYLVAYNSLCAVLWGTVLGYAVVVPLYKGYPFLGIVANDFVRWTQTIAVLEILHSLFGEPRAPISTIAESPRKRFADGIDGPGLVRSPLLTVVMQVWSRIAIVWGPLYFFPSVAMSPAFTTLLLAWGLTETVRYTYFALQLSTGSVPRFITLLRYNMFFVLYPVGAGSEMVLLWQAARGLAKDTQWEVVFYALLLLHYPFGKPESKTYPD
jgi:very-long-chain (3R)-3-hydroxyacyl-CoA dehydratase